MTDASVAPTVVAPPTFTDTELAILVDCGKIVSSLGIMPTDPDAAATMFGVLDRITDYLSEVGYVGDAGSGATIGDLFDPSHPDFLGS